MLVFVDFRANSGQFLKKKKFLIFQEYWQLWERVSRDTWCTFNCCLQSCHWLKGKHSFQTPLYIVVSAFPIHVPYSLSYLLIKATKGDRAGIFGRLVKYILFLDTRIIKANWRIHTNVVTLLFSSAFTAFDGAMGNWP